MDPPGQWTFPRKDLWVMGGSLATYAIGAIIGALTESHWGLLSILWPCADMAIVIFTALASF